MSDEARKLASEEVSGRASERPKKRTSERASKQEHAIERPVRPRTHTCARSHLNTIINFNCQLIPLRSHPRDSLARMRSRSLPPVAPAAHSLAHAPAAANGHFSPLPPSRPARPSRVPRPRPPSKDLVWERVASGAINVFMAVPTVYAKLVAHWEQQPRDKQETVGTLLVVRACMRMHASMHMQRACVHRSVAWRGVAESGERSGACVCLRVACVCKASLWLLRDGEVQELVVSRLSPTCISSLDYELFQRPRSEIGACIA